jgi:predicted permease
VAFGIGANTAIFSAVDALLLRSAPVADPDRVVSVHFASPDGRNPFAVSGYSYLDYADLRDSGALDGLAAFAGIAAALDSNGASEQVIGDIVSGNYFDVLGVRIPLGRAFSADEDRVGSPVRVVVLSHTFWKQRLAGDVGAVGRSITLNGNAYTVIGVTPPGFSSHVLGRAPELFVPMALQQEVRPPTAGLRRQLGHANLLSVRGGGWLNLVGRLRPNASLTETAAALDVVGRRLDAEFPTPNRPRRYAAARLGEAPGVRSAARPLLGVLSGAVAIVLLIACANVASLLAARAVSRRREVAVRIAVGAARGRLIRQWLTESVLLATAGSAGALLVARWTTPILYRFGVPESVDMSVNARVLGFALAVGVVCGLVFGLAPVLQALRRDTLTALRDDGGAIASGVRSARMRKAFVVVQVALSLVLLIGAGLFLRTLHNAYSVDLGYNVSGVLLAEINLDVRGYSQQAGQDVYRRLLEGMQALPGVRSAGAARVTVLSGGARMGSISLDGRPVQPDGSNGLTVRVNVITDSYLDAMGIPIVNGRGFRPSDSESAPTVAIVSRSLAERVWPHQNPIGRPLDASPSAPTVIGVVPDTVYANAIERDPHPFFYLPLSQNYESGVTFHIRSATDPMALLPAVRQVVREIDPQLTVARPRTLVDELDRSVGDQRLMATMVGLFGGLALLLASVGLYGAMSYAAGQRRPEIGLRLALGASPVGILSMIVGDGLRLVFMGSVLGLAGAVAASRLIESQLFGVKSIDPFTYVAVVLVLVFVGAIACALPARRAMLVDPVEALKSF